MSQVLTICYLIRIEKLTLLFSFSGEETEFNAFPTGAGAVAIRIQVSLPSWIILPS
jgi:hypothetical protein